MAGEVFDFVRHGGGDTTTFPSLEAEVAIDFLPSLALLATDVPSYAPLLSSLASHPDTPGALAYAALHYTHIARMVREVEEEASLSSSSSSSSSLERQKTSWKSSLLEQADELDDSLAFELAADEKERVALTIISLRKRSKEFSLRIKDGRDPEQVWFQECRDEGSMWNNELCMSELLCILPIAVARCPTLLRPEDVIQGLLTTKWGNRFLVTTFLNNPFVLKRGLYFLSEFMALQEQVINGPGSSSTDSAVAAFGPTSTQQMASKVHSTQHTHGSSNEQVNVVVVHCINQAIWTFLRIFRISHTVALWCREALCHECAFAELALHITADALHDELEFLSRMIFANQRTSQWMLSFLANPQKASMLSDLNKNLSIVRPSSQTGEMPRDDSLHNQQGVVSRVRKALLVDAQCTRKHHGWGGRLHGHLRLFCVIIRAGDSQPTHEEIVFWLETLGGEFDIAIDELLDNSELYCRTNRFLVSSSKMEKFVSERTLLLGFSFFCVVPGLTVSTNKQLFHKALYFLLRTAISGGSKSYSEFELAVWLSVQLLLRRFSDIAMVVRETLGVHVTIHNLLMRELYDAAVTADIISEPTYIVKAAARLHPQGSISSNKKNGLLTLKCLEQLSSSRNFLRFQVDISETVMHCISISEEPIHPLLCQIIQTMAEIHPAKLDTITPSISSIPRPFLEESFQMIYSGPGMKELDEADPKDTEVSEIHMARAVLTSYYIICRENFLRNAGPDVWYESSESLIFKSGRTEEDWWLEMIRILPFKDLFFYMEYHWIAYEHIFPQWVSLASFLFPEKFVVLRLLDDSTVLDVCQETAVHGVPRTDVLDWVNPDACDLNIDKPMIDNDEPSLQGHNATSVCLLINKDDSNPILSSEVARSVLRKALEEPPAVLHLLNVLLRNVKEWKGHAEEKILELLILVMKELVPLLLHNLCPRSLQDSFCLLWSNLSPAIREILLPDFVVSLSSKSSDNGDIGVLTSQLKQLVLQLEHNVKSELYKDIAQAPLALLNCKADLFRSPLLTIFLDILMEFLIINRRICQSVASDAGKEETLKREEVASALLAQDSAVCQILLEACMPNTRLDNNITPGPLLEARRIICRFFSSILQMNPLLLKLLHFQGYHPCLIPMMVEGIPTMSQCLDFAHELLLQKAQKQQIFAITLIANIASAYPELPQSVSSVQQAVAHVSFVQNKVSGNVEFLREVLSAMAQCASAFPSVAIQVVTILQKCVHAAGPLADTGTPRDPALHTAALSAFRQFVQQKLLYGRPSPVQSRVVSDLCIS